MNYFKRLMNYLMTRAKHRKVIKELNMLTDRELSDIGISRGQINELIWLEEDFQKSGN